MTNQPRPTRIAFVSDAIYPYHKGGKEKRLYEISLRLARQGHDVHIYTMKWWDGPRDIVREGVHLHAICPIYPLYQGERRSMKEAIMFGLAAFKLAFARFDVADIDSMPFFPLLSARVACWIRRRPMYATWHEVTSLTSWRAYAGPVAGLIAWSIERLSMHTADAIIAVSAQTAQRLRVNGFKRPITTIPLGVDLPAIARVKPAQEACDIIYAGRLVAHKNLDLLIKAIAIIKPDYPSIKAKIIGQGPEKARLGQLIGELGLTGHVELIKPIDQATDLYALMKAAKVFALPSIREGFSAVAIEANAAGIPVITTNHPDNAARQLITEGVNGYITEPAVEAIARALRQVLETRRPLQPSLNVGQYDWDTVARNISQTLAA